MSNEKKFAVLIDADNVSGKYVKLILDEVSNDGIATYKRIYGDWTKPSLASWKSVLLDYSVVPVQQYSYTTGKNATDSAMIIDAMDILYSGNVDGFCLVSSDSDFTRLASRLRESGMTVIGMGESKTPSAFIAACQKFKYLDVLAEGEKSEAVEKTAASLKTIRRAVLTIVRENSDEEGWAFIGDVGNVLIKRYPDFDVRNYGFAKLTPFIKSLGVFESRTVVGANNAKLVYVRDRNQAAQIAQKAALDAAQQEAEASARAAGIILPGDEPEKSDLPVISVDDPGEIAELASDAALAAAAEEIVAAAEELLPEPVGEPPAAVGSAAQEAGDDDLDVFADEEIVLSTQIVEADEPDADARVEKIELVRGTPGRRRSRRGGRGRRGRGNAAAGEAISAVTGENSADVNAPAAEEASSAGMPSVTESIPESVEIKTADPISASVSTAEVESSAMPAVNAPAVPAGENSGENGENPAENSGDSGENLFASQQAESADADETPDTDAAESSDKPRSRSRRRGRRGGRGRGSRASADAPAETVPAVEKSVEAPAETAPAAEKPVEAPAEAAPAVEKSVEAPAETAPAVEKSVEAPAETASVAEKPVETSAETAPAAEEPKKSPARRRGRPRKVETVEEGAAEEAAQSETGSAAAAESAEAPAEAPAKSTRSRRRSSSRTKAAETPADAAGAESAPESETPAAEAPADAPAKPARSRRRASAKSASAEGEAPAEAASESEAPKKTSRPRRRRTAAADNTPETPAAGNEGDNA